MDRKLYEQIPTIVETATSLAVDEYEDDTSNNSTDTVKVFESDPVCIEVRERPHLFEVKIFSKSMEGQYDARNPLLVVRMQPHAWLYPWLSQKLKSLTNHQVTDQIPWPPRWLIDSWTE